MRRSGWHPLLEIKVRQLGPWQIVEGYDPIDNHRCQILSKSRLEERGPTFLNVDEPGRITCSLEQLQGLDDDRLNVFKARGWFGVGSVEEAITAKAARSGDQGAMSSYARSRSFRHLGRDNRISEVAQFVDLRAALYWFEAAAKKGSDEAKLELAYLQDVIDQDAQFARWREGYPGKPLATMPDAFRTPLSGTMTRTLCAKVAERLENLKELAATRQSGRKHWMDGYYLRELRASEEYLNEVASRPHHHRLSQAIRSFLKATPLAA